MASNKPQGAPNTNNTQKTKTSDKLELLKIAVNDFANKQMQKESDAVKFYDLVVNDNGTLGTNFKDFIKLTAYSSINFGDKDTPESLFNDLLKANTIKTCVKLESSRKKIEEVLKSFYDINNYSKIYAGIKTKTVGELNILLSSEIERKKFLDKIYLNDKSNRPKEIDFYYKLDKLFNLKGVKLSLEQEKSIKKFISYRDNVSISDINIIINSDPKLFNTIEQKQLLIKTFLPTVNLQQLIDWKIIDKHQLKIAIDTEYKSILNKYGVSEDNIGENLLIDPSDIIISTFTFPEETVDKILHNDGLSYIVNEVNKMKEEVRKNDNILNHLDNDKTNDSFIKYIEESNEIESKEIKENIKKLNKGNYIKISRKDKDGIENVQFFYVNNIDKGSTVETKTLQFTNVTKIGGIADHNSITADPAITYQSFYNLLKLLDSDKNSSIIFYDNINKGEDKIDNETGEVLEEGKSEFENEGIKVIKEDDEVNNIIDLKNALDVIDINGNLVPINKMSFIAQADKINKQEESSFTVESISDNNEILLSNNEKFSFQDFLGIFKQRKCERFERNNTFSDLIGGLTKLGDNFKEYNGLIISNSGKIVQESEKDNSNFEGIEYFVGDDGTAIHITKTNNGGIEFVTGEYKEGKKDKGNTFEGKYKHNNLDEFYYYAKKYNLQPKIDIQIEEEEIGKLKRSGSLFKSWFSMLSVAEIIAGGTQLIDSIEQGLAQGNKLKSAKFAQKLGKLIPGFDDSDLQSIVEGEEKKTMQEMTDALKQLDSKVMIPKVEKILKNSSSEQYEIEAALMATIKYGTLYPKGDLKKYRGKFLWFQALGGELSDIPRIKKELLEDDPNVIINEEAIVFSLLKQQAGGKGKYKRRSKIHKEFQSSLDEGIDKELGDGEKDTGDKMTLEGRINQVMGELGNGTYANGIGGMEKIWGKGPTPAYAMNTIPFVMTISGIARDFPQKLINKIMGMGWETPYTALTFNNKSSNIDLYSNVTEKVIESFEGKDGNMMKSFKKIKSAKQGSAVGAAYDFWNEYGSKINSRLNLSDGYIFANKEKDNDFGEYVEWLKGVHTDKEFKIKSEDITSGVVDYKTNPLFFTGGKKLFRGNFKFDQSGNLQKEGGILLNQVLAELRDIRNLKLSENSEENKLLQKKLYKELYSSIEPAIRKGLGTFENKSGNSPEIKMLKREGIDISEFTPNDKTDFVGTTKHDNMYGYIESERYDNFLDNKWKDYIEGNNNTNNSDSVDGNEEVTKESVLDILDGFDS